MEKRLERRSNLLFEDSIPFNILTPRVLFDFLGSSFAT